MSTLDELIHYCNETNPIGACMLTGEWGCGKTYLIENELAGALKDTHVIVRVSLFGMDSSAALHRAVRQKWFEVCMPVLGSLQKAKDRGFFSAFYSVLRKINPVAGGAADVMVSMNVLDLIALRPEVEEVITHKKKKVILVFDDLERVRMDAVELMGVINEYCENQNFNTIISANEESFMGDRVTDRVSYHLLREKTVSQTIYHIPDYKGIIHATISSEDWRTPEYAEYLTEHEDLINDVFASDMQKPEIMYSAADDRKYHNFRTLRKGLQSCYRIYYHIQELGSCMTDEKLYSFLAYYLAAKSGICRNGTLCIELSDADIKEFYPGFDPAEITDAERHWISDGIWNGDRFSMEFANGDVE